MNYKKILPYLIAISSFILVTLFYFSPVLDGKKLYQSDIAQYRGMSKEIKDFRAKNHEEPYWTDAAFGGMPAYQISAYYPHDYIKKLDKLIRFLPRPADYLMLYFLSFFVLMLVLKVDWRLAVIGALAFGFSTYLIIIIGVGHNAKAHAIGYMPLVMAGVLLLFNKKYFVGFILTTLATALEIVAGHIQMTYYLFFILFFIGLVYFIQAVKDKQVSSFFKAFSLVLVAGLLAIAMNANHLMPTREYAAESTRSSSELSMEPDGSAKPVSSGLNKEYITEYSYGILETFNLFIPRLMGGGNAEDLGTDSETYHFLKDKIGVKQAKDFAKHAPTYWGNQPIVAAPAYIGAVLIFLFVLSLFLLQSKTKKWVLAALVFALLLSWGKNLSFLTDFFIDYVPLYNKFRAVSSIQVILEIGIPILAILALQRFFFDDTLSKEQKEKALKKSFYIAGGLTLFFLLLGSSWFAFEGANDAYYDKMIPDFSQALILDRKSLLFQDSLRTLLLVTGAAGVLWLFIKEKLRLYPGLGLLLFLMLFDGIGVARRYVNSDDFSKASKIENPFKASPADKEILKDTGHYRVVNFTVNPLNDAGTSYFHNSIGGYHAAKPRRYQELFDYQIAKNNIEVLNMLNAKYLILGNDKGQTQVQENPDVYGNAWFVNQIKWVESADQAIQALDSISKNTAVLDIKYKPLIPKSIWMIDSTAHIQLKTYQPNQISYKSTSHIPQLALFSEMYYPHGWKAFVDGKEYEILRANYVLRALLLPEGEHSIVFTFDPEVVKEGGTISLYAYLLFLVLVLIGVFIVVKKPKALGKNKVK